MPLSKDEIDENVNIPEALSDTELFNFVIRTPSTTKALLLFTLQLINSASTRGGNYIIESSYFSYHTISNISYVRLFN